VESKKARLENAASLENEDGTLDGENVELNDDEFVISKLDCYIWV
jgi:hypothetical protein